MTVGDWGEKRIIRDLIKPLFNPANDLDGVGDDCAILACKGKTLISTDRVPHDLTAFAHGYIGFSELGRYAANLNLSDIAASGGVPVALLLSLALPPTMFIADLHEFCTGFLEGAQNGGAKVIGGDITDASSFSATITAIGETGELQPIRRATAMPGDLIFVTRDIGLSPAALAMARGKRIAAMLTPAECALLAGQFRLDAMVGTARMLAGSGVVTACMDNTDGVGNCLAELSDASSVCFIVERASVDVHPLALKIAQLLDQDPVEFAFSGGADFSLIGTCSTLPSDAALLRTIRIIGRVERGSGVELEESGQRTVLRYRGWNYFQQQ